MIFEWALIISVTLVSVTMLMIIGTYLAILPEAQAYFGQSRTKILLLSNSFNIFYIIVSPMMFNILNKNYFIFVVLSTLANCIGAVGRYMAGTNYDMALFFTGVVAVSHIPIITAPYGLLKLFPDWQKGYASSIPLFLPVLGINYCILYGMQYIASSDTFKISKVQAALEIDQLNFNIMIVGIISTASTLFFLFSLKDKIEAPEDMQQVSQEESSTLNSAPSENTMREVADSGISKYINYCKKYSFTIINITCWGIILGISWTYGAVFGIIFDGQNLSGKEIALIGLAANLSTAFFSNLGTFIHNRWNIPNIKVITLLNIYGFVAGSILLFAKYFSFLQNVWILILLIIILRAGYSSFVSLSFIQMEKSKLSSVILSGIFFWVANVSNLVGMNLVDFIDSSISMPLLTLFVSFCIYKVANNYIDQNIKDLEDQRAQDA